MFATDILFDRTLTSDATNILIVGGGEVGCETAHMLAYECGKSVTVVEQSVYFMQDTCTANRGYLIHYLEQKGVTLWNCSRINKIRDGLIEVTRNISPCVPPPYAVWQPVLPKNIRNPLARELRIEEQTVTVPADLIVFATGLKPHDALYRQCVEAKVAPDIRNIGDSFEVGRIFDATKAGYAVGSSL